MVQRWLLTGPAQANAAAVGRAAPLREARMGNDVRQRRWEAAGATLCRASCW